MKTRFRPRKYGFLPALTTSLVISGCAPVDKPAAGSPEALLEAEGDWALVEEGQALDPAQAHLNTRQQVNPNAVAAHNSYTQKMADASMDGDVKFRVLRLERQMDALKGDFGKILPPLDQKAKADLALSKALKDISASHAAIAPAAGAEIGAATINPYPTAKTVKPMVMQKASAGAPDKKGQSASKAPSGALQVSGVRVGDHPGKTRLVLDVSGPAKFTAEVDAAEKIMIVELPGVKWGASASRTFAGNPLVKSYSAEPSGDGTRLVIELKKAAKLTMKSAMPPNSEYGHRIAFDLTGA